MATKTNKIKFNLKNVYVAKLTITNDGGFSYGTPRHIPGAVSLSLDAEGESSPFYADGIVYFRSTSNNGYTGSLEMALIPDWFREEYLREIKDKKGVLVESANITEQVYFALLFEFDGDVKKIRHCMYQCTASRPSVSSQTKESNITPVTETLNLTADPRSDGLVKSKTGEDTNDATYANWYRSVYIPAVTEEEMNGETDDTSAAYAKLASLTIGSLTLDPAFDADTTAYAVTTDNATNAVSATGADGASVAITVNGTMHTSGQSATWNTGSNTVTVTVTKSGYTTRTYTVTVTKNE